MNRKFDSYQIHKGKVWDIGLLDGATLHEAYLTACPVRYTEEVEETEAEADFR